MKGAETTRRQDFKVQDTLTYLWTSAWGWNYPRPRAKGRRKRMRERERRATWRWRATGCKRNLRMSTEGRQRGVAQGDLYWSPYECLNYKRILSTFVFFYTFLSLFSFYIFLLSFLPLFSRYLGWIFERRLAKEGRENDEEEILLSRNRILLSNRDNSISSRESRREIISLYSLHFGWIFLF